MADSHLAKLVLSPSSVVHEDVVVQLHLNGLPEKKHNRERGGPNGNFPCLYWMQRRCHHTGALTVFKRRVSVSLLGPMAHAIMTYLNELIFIKDYLWFCPVWFYGHLSLESILEIRKPKLQRFIYGSPCDSVPIPCNTQFNHILFDLPEHTRVHFAIAPQL